MLLIIDNYDSFTYNLYQLLAGMGEEVEVVRNDRTTIEEVKASDLLGVVLSPGPGRPEEAGICVELLHDASPRLPILGICLGMQAMAIAYGGTVGRAAEAVHGRASEVVHTGSGLFAGLPSPFPAARYHSLAVTDLGDLRLDTSTRDGVPMGVSHPLYCRHGLQFHPESILTPHGELLMRNFLDICHLQEQREGRCA